MQAQIADSLRHLKEAAAHLAEAERAIAGTDEDAAAAIHRLLQGTPRRNLPPGAAPLTTQGNRVPFGPGSAANGRSHGTPGTRRRPASPPSVTIHDAHFERFAHVDMA